MNIAELPELLKPGTTELRSGVQVGGKQNSPFWGEIVTDKIPHRASRIEFARRITTSCALGQAGRPPHPPTTPGRSTLRSLSEATNYDQPQVRILLGVLFCGGGVQLLLQLAR